MVSVSKIKMEANIATVLKTAAQMNMASVSDQKSQVRLFTQNLNSENPEVKVFQYE